MRASEFLRTFAKKFRSLERTTFSRFNCGRKSMILWTKWPDFIIWKQNGGMPSLHVYRICSVHVRTLMPR